MLALGGEAESPVLTGTCGRRSGTDQDSALRAAGVQGGCSVVARGGLGSLPPGTATLYFPGSDLMLPSLCLRLSSVSRELEGDASSHAHAHIQTRIHTHTRAHTRVSLRTAGVLPKGGEGEPGGGQKRGLSRRPGSRRAGGSPPNQVLG